MREMGVGEVVGWSVVIYSTVRNKHETNWKQANGDYFNQQKADLILLRDANKTKMNKGLHDFKK